MFNNLQFCVFLLICLNNNCCLFICQGDIIFNARYPELPPDFIFGEDAEFLPEPSELPVSNLFVDNFMSVICIQLCVHQTANGKKS